MRLLFEVSSIKKSVSCTAWIAGTKTIISELIEWCEGKFRNISWLQISNQITTSRDSQFSYINFVSANQVYITLFSWAGSHVDEVLQNRRWEREGQNTCPIWRVYQLYSGIQTVVIVPPVPFKMYCIMYWNVSLSSFVMQWDDGN